MKDTYFSNSDDPVLANEKLKSKIQYLQRELLKKDSYLKDLQISLSLNKQSIKKMNDIGSKNSSITKLNQQNSFLHERLKKQYEQLSILNAKLLMESQLRIEDSKFFNERITQFENNMADLRRYLHDKEDSFSAIVQRLKKYQQLQMPTMYDKARNFSQEINQNITKDAFMKLATEKEFYADKCEKLTSKIQKLQVINYGIKKEMNIKQFQSYIQSVQMKSTNIGSNISNIKNDDFKGKNESNMSTNIMTYIKQGKFKQIDPNKQLIRLLKKEKLNGEILQEALDQAISKNSQLLQYNARLVQSLTQKQTQMDSIIAQMVILCQQLIRYDTNYRIKLRLLKHRSKCDIDQPYFEMMQKYKQNSQKDAQAILFSKIREDVSIIGQYLPFANLKKTNIKSFQSPRRMYDDKHKQQEFIDQNGEQLFIEQI